MCLSSPLNPCRWRVQNDLFNLGADLRTPDLENDATAKHPRLWIVAAQVAGLETEIDAMNARLMPLRSFQAVGQGTTAREGRGFPFRQLVHYLGRNSGRSSQ